MRVAARSRISDRPQEESPAPEDWLPSELLVAPPGASTAVEVAERAEAVPADPAAAAELGAEVQRLRRELGEAEKLAQSERTRAERGEREVKALRERGEAMKRAAGEAAAAAHPAEGREDSTGRLNLNDASFEQLRAIGLTVTQAARLIGQREQHDGFQSVDDVDGVVGLPRDVKQSLKDHGSV